MADPISPYAGYAAASADKYSIPRSILYGLIRKESNWDATAISPANKNGTYDYGIAQLNSSTFPNAQTMTVPQQLDTAASYLAQGYAASGSWGDALRYYNGGPKALDNKGLSASYSADVLKYANGYGYSTGTTTAAPTVSGSDQDFMTSGQYLSFEDAAAAMDQAARDYTGTHPNEGTATDPGKVGTTPPTIGDGINGAIQGAADKLGAAINKPFQDFAAYFAAQTTPQKLIMYSIVVGGGFLVLSSILSSASGPIASVAGGPMMRSAMKAAKHA